jgi:hypothetical protein
VKMICNLVRKLLLAWLLSSISLLILSIFFNHLMWFDLAITMLIMFPIYFRISDRLDVDVI